MAFEPVNPLLRSLCGQGLQYVLADCDAPPELSLLQGPKTQQAVKPKSPRVSPVKNWDAAEQDAPSTSSAKPAPRAQPRPDPSSWPEIWQKRLKATAVTPVIWTYAALKDDLGGAPSPARREFFKKLFKDLGHPPGTHSFWPFVLRRNGEDDERPDIFWQAMRLRRARALVLVDAQTLKALDLPQSLQPLHFIRKNGLHILMAGDIDGLIGEEAGRYEALSGFLRHNLRAYIRL